MALSVKVGQIDSKTSTGNQAYTGVGFTPKALILWSDGQSANGSLGEVQFGIGFATATDKRAAVCTNSADAVTSSNCRLRHTNGKCFTLITTSEVLFLEADLVSFDADGFTLNWTTANATARKIHYMALGGDSITNAVVFQFQAPTSAQSVAYTGVGFQPDAMLTITALNSSAPPVSASTGVLGIGAAAASGQAASSIGMRAGQADANTIRTQVSDKCIHVATPVGNTVNISASLTSFNADGFTLNWTTASSARYCWALCLAGDFSSKVGVETQKTSTGTKATTGLGFEPSALLFGTVCAAQSSAVQDHARLTFGATDGTANAGQWVGDRDAAADMIANRHNSVTKCLLMMTEGTSASPTTEAAADIDSLDSDGFTLDWTTADGTAREFWYLALGEEAAPPPASDWEPYARKPLPAPEPVKDFFQPRDLTPLLQPTWLPRRREEPAFIAKVAEELKRRSLSFIFPSYQGLAKYWCGVMNIAGSIYVYDLPFNNLQASTDPGTGDDEGDNYAPGSIWINKSGQKAFVCIRATVGAAVWREVEDATSLLAAHEAAADPHPGYTTAAELAAYAQPLDADLTALAALSGTNTIYYRSAADTWTAVTIDPSLTFTGGTLASVVTTSNTRVKLTGARTYYVRTDGSDSNTGLVDSAGGAFLTIQKAVDVAAALDNAGFDITIQVGDGTYTGSVALKNMIGGGTIIIRGDPTTPADVLISTTSASAITANGIVSGHYKVTGIKVTTTTAGHAFAIESLCPGLLWDFELIEFGAMATGYMHIVNEGGAKFRATGNYSIVGNAQWHCWLAYSGSTLESVGRTVTLTGTPAFGGGFLRVAYATSAAFYSSTFSGSATGKRYELVGNGVIFANGETLPGDAAGTAATGGQYI